MTKKTALLGLAFVLSALVLLVVLLSCDKSSEEHPRAAEIEALRHDLDAERARTEGAEADFSVAAAIAGSCALGMVLVLALLAREVRAKRVLARILKSHKDKENT